MMVAVAETAVTEKEEVEEEEPSSIPTQLHRQLSIILCNANEHIERIIIRIVRLISRVFSFFGRREELL